MLNRIWLKYFAACWKMVYKNELVGKSEFYKNYCAAKAAIVSSKCKIR